MKMDGDHTASKATIDSTSSARSRDDETPKRKPKRKSKAKNSKKPSDMPRRPLSAYNIFFKHTRGVILAEREDESVPADPDVPADSKGASLFAQLGRTIARRWKELPEGEMAEFKAKAQEDMKRYRREMEQYHLNVARKTRLETEAMQQESAIKPAPTEDMTRAAFEDSKDASRLGTLHRLHSPNSGVQANDRNSLLQSLLSSQSGVGAGMLAQQLSTGMPNVYEQVALQQAQLQLQSQLQQQRQQQQIQQLQRQQQQELQDQQLLRQQQQQQQALNLARRTGMFGFQQHNPLMDQLMSSIVANPSLSAEAALGDTSFGTGRDQLGSPNYLENILRAGDRGRTVVTGLPDQSSDYQLALIQHQQLFQAATEQRDLEQMLCQQIEQRALQLHLPGGAAVSMGSDLARASNNDDSCSEEESK